MSILQNTNNSNKNKNKFHTPIETNKVPEEEIFDGNIHKSHLIKCKKMASNWENFKKKVNESEAKRLGTDTKTLLR